MRRDGRSGVEWQTLETPNFTWEQVNTEVLMDIRAELRALNRLLNCSNFLRIPRELGDIRRAVNRIPPRKRKK